MQVLGLGASRARQRILGARFLVATIFWCYGDLKQTIVPREASRGRRLPSSRLLSDLWFLEPYI